MAKADPRHGVQTVSIIAEGAVVTFLIASCSRVLLGVTALAVAVLGLQGCKPACGAENSISAAAASALSDADAAGQPHARPKPPKKAPCPSKGKSNDSKKMFGANGVKVTSKTLANGAVGQYKYRIDVENPAPGERPGSLHVQLGGRGSTHYEYRRGGKFYSRAGRALPKQVQQAIDGSSRAQAAIKSGLRILGEK